MNSNSIATKIVSLLRSSAAPLTTGQICRAIADKAHSIRARLSERAGVDFVRVGRGLYAPMHGGQCGIQGDSLEILEAMADAGHRPDFFIEDLPYSSAGVKGGNRNLADFDTVDPATYGRHLDAVDRMAGDNTPIVFIFSNGPSSRKARKAFQAEMDKRFTLVREYVYQKTTKDGAPVKFGKHTIPTEGVMIYTRSGRLDTAAPEALEIAGVRPWRQYPTQKPLTLWERLFSLFCKAGDLVLDPWSGSGSAAVVAEAQGIRGIHIDKAHNPIQAVRRWFGEALVTK